MKMYKLLAIALFVMTTSAVAVIQRDYGQRNVFVGQEFKVKFDYSPSVPVQWYVLLPTGPGIELVDIKEEPSARGMMERVEIKEEPSRVMRFVRAQRMLPGGDSRVRTFTFRATMPTDDTVYAIRFIKIDFSNKIYDSKKVEYRIAPEISVALPRELVRLK